MIRPQRRRLPPADQEGMATKGGTVSVIPFPAIELTKEDEDAIIAKAYLAGYCCSRTSDDDRGRSIVLLNGRREVRGYVTKQHCVYEVLDARRSVVAKSRSLSTVLTALEK
jgi:hypothetical protein